MTDNSLHQNWKIQWTPETLSHYFLPLYNLISQQPSATGFQEEVDAEALGIPDYYKVITNPMALCTILEKLNNGKYSDPWKIVNDFWLMFNNCLYFNRKSTQIYNDCLQLMEIFTENATNIMTTLGFCCANLYFYEPKLKQCSTTKGCLIKTNDTYYLANSPQAEFVVCGKCYANGKEFIQITESNKIHRDLFLQCKNDVREDEQFVECTRCGKNLHNVCVLYRDCGNLFICPQCQNNSTKASTNYSANLIPSSDLSAFIESRVNNTLKKADPSVKHVIIRDFVDTENKIGYLSKIKEKYGMNESHEYTIRALYAFTTIDDVDIMFFGLHVQEYSPDISGPNKGCVSITYLDSVSYFEPRHLKTQLYREILLSYLDYVRRKGMLHAYLWVCPPEIGNDYIFHRHPMEQKLPKKDRLKIWYETIFQKGIDESVVLKYESIADYYNGKSITKPSELAYFDGDFWPGEIETLLTEIDKDVKNRLNVSTKVSRKRKRKHKDSDTMFDLENVDGEIDLRLKKLLNKWGDDFIVVTLMELSIKEEAKVDTNTADWICEILETRDKFLPFCKDYNLEFSSIRRVKYATMRILNEIFRENKKFKFFCNQCHQKNILVRYFCKRCLDYDLCEKCYMENTHEHELFKEEVTTETFSIDQLSELVSHTFVCIEQDCVVPRCNRMKEIKRHFDICNVPSCKSCKEAYAAFLNHSKKCKVTSCAVYTCSIKEKMKRNPCNPTTIVQQPLNEKSLNEALMPMTRQPFSQSTPNANFQMCYNDQVLQEHINIIKLKVKELKQLPLDKEDINRQFSEFMRNNTHLKTAYLKEMEAHRVNQEFKTKANPNPPVQIRQIIQRPVNAFQEPVYSQTIKPEKIYLQTIKPEKIYPQTVVQVENKNNHFDVSSNRIVNYPQPINVSISTKPNTICYRMVKKENMISDVPKEVRIVPLNKQGPNIHIRCNGTKQHIKIDPSDTTKIKPIYLINPQNSTNHNIKTIRVFQHKRPSDSKS